MAHSKDIKILKEEIKREVIRKINTLKDENAVKDIVNEMASRYSFLSDEQRLAMMEDIMNDLIGLGQIEKLLKDPSVSEIMINGPSQVYVERDGNLEIIDMTFKNDDEVMHLVEKVIHPLGKHITEMEPFVDARLKDGSRLNVIISPLSLSGPVVTIRKFLRRILNMDDLLKLGSLNQDAAEHLKQCAASRLNIIICGGPSSGKTTLLNILSGFMPQSERIITIEDSVELQLLHKHKVSLQTRSPNVEGKGEITIRELIKNSLHMRPDRLIVGEARGEETLDMLQAMNIGQRGSMTTLHANSPYDALLRLETMSMMANANISLNAIRRQIVSSIDIIVQVVRLPNGFRGVARICELKKDNYNEYNIEEIFVFDKNAGRLVKL